MVKKELKILMVDDHPMILEGYKNVLLQIDTGYDLAIDVAGNCDTAYSKILQAIPENHYNIIFLDISLPPSADGEIMSGEDLGIRVKELSPKTKIIVLTMFDDNFRIRNIMANLEPDSFILKNEATASILTTAFKTILDDVPYYSPTVTKLLKAQLSNTFVLDKIDRSIIYHLSKGTKTKQLPEYINLSLRAIENRKRRLKDVFGLENGDDRALLDKARECGYI
ncbi:response regulator [Sinomicrobium kalidii]|uniref:response regulator n=1 Tax=Sinomicrobium kalidii TaxID=2900738 RepID=UPI001E53B6C5|nr:response regulator [Sinomicrobium kalidii]UGU16860.1 response regulator [Sinomicrobium kalidii]